MTALDIIFGIFLGLMIVGAIAEVIFCCFNERRKKK